MARVGLVSRAEAQARVDAERRPVRPVRGLDPRRLPPMPADYV